MPGARGAEEEIRVSVRRVRDRNNRSEAMTEFPKEVIVYVSDYNNGKTIFGVAENVEGVPEGCADEKVAVYTLNRTYTFKVKRELLG